MLRIIHSYVVIETQNTIVNISLTKIKLTSVQKETFEFNTAHIKLLTPSSNKL